MLGQEVIRRPSAESGDGVLCGEEEMGLTVLARNESQQHKDLIFQAFSYDSVRLESLLLFSIEDFCAAN